MREVSIANRHPGLRLSRPAVAQVIAVVDAEGATIAGHSPAILPGELSLVFLTDAALAQIHAAFLGDPAPTDVITFEGDRLLGTAGEICISADTAAKYAREHGRDFSHELTLYIIHGWLHLAGHDDRTPVKKRAMRKAECRAMGRLERAGAVPEFTLKATLKNRAGPEARRLGRSASRAARTSETLETTITVARKTAPNLRPP